MLPIVIATGNPHKVEEMREIFDRLAPRSHRFLGLSDVTPAGPAGFREPAETGSTFEENATIKARSYAAQTGRLCLADDSGLEIDALDGRPGVISSHYSSGGREIGLPRADRDLANNARVLGELSGVPPERRTARFVCVMVVARPDGTVQARSRGEFHGRIGLPGDVPRGTNGFGYDPIFLVGPAFTRTSAELTAAEKNRLSHRAEAARLLVPLLFTP